MPRTPIGTNKLKVRPDPQDIRDRMYNPILRPLQPSYNDSPWTNKDGITILDQGQTSACTGYALAAMIDHLLRRAKRDAKIVSPMMLYYFARKYDDISSMDPEGGSTARGAMKGWHKHGACELELWPDGQMTPPAKSQDWAVDGFVRPLGAYYRVDHKSIPDMHAAIEEIGLIYVTSMVHKGWDAPKNGTIEMQGKADEGHAFLIVGYDREGFWIQNSWGTTWGNKGYARLTYQDWLLNGMDAWVGQLGVHISSAIETIGDGMSVSNANRSINPGVFKTTLSSDASVAAQQVSPYIVDIGDNGELSQSGQFATTQDDLNNLVTQYLKAHKEDFRGPDGKIHVAMYAHGGLVSEQSADETAKRWVPFLLNAGIFPVFFMWETGVMEILNDMVATVLHKGGTAAGASFWDRVQDWADDRIEGLVSPIGTRGWDEIKNNAIDATTNDKGAIRALYQAFIDNASDLKGELKFHMIGHSAGAIFHSALVYALVNNGFDVDGMYMMAPAIRRDTFNALLAKTTDDGRNLFGPQGVKTYVQFHLRDDDELNDNCHPLPYNKSLLYLVSNAFERAHATPILGMQKFTPPLVPPQNMAEWQLIVSRFDPRGAGDPRFRCSSQSHGGFGDDPDCMTAIATWIHSRMKPGTPAVVDAPGTKVNA